MGELIGDHGAPLHHSAYGALDGEGVVECAERVGEGLNPHPHKALCHLLCEAGAYGEHSHLLVQPTLAGADIYLCAEFHWCG